MLFEDVTAKPGYDARMQFYAHSRKADDPGEWQRLEEHLHAVSSMAETFAPTGWKEQARLAGLLHDAGKYQAAFQKYIAENIDASNEGKRGTGVQHAIVGATLAMRIGPTSLPAALAVQAHHGKLKSVDELRTAAKEIGEKLLRNAERDGLPPALGQERAPKLPTNDALALAMGTRFVFSALVDADLLDTEAWDKAQARQTASVTITELAKKIEESCRERVRNTPETALNRMRAEVLDSCLRSAELAPGTFTLTVPTGGGKTLSGLAFALRHAVRHDLRRVIVVAPYTSILEQMVEVYRATLGAENVVEHHSSLDPDRETDRNRQACENWDAPVIVTTSVQFFETLYGARNRRCRKMHRIAESVIFLDEVQTFPEQLLQPIHAALDLLTKHFGASVVHSTATQPRLALRQAGQAPREVVPGYKQHFPVIAGRFRLEVLGSLDEPVSMKRLAEEMRGHPQALAIVHRRSEAEELARLLGPGCLHLSARMCAEHRTAVLAEVKHSLLAGKPCLLAATQLVEAGVDLDFPVLFRALAGLETLAQAAGRCNRELRLSQPGRFVVFRAPSEPPAPSLKRGLGEAEKFFRKGLPDLADPDLFAAYSRALLLGLASNLDANDVLPYERKLDFPEVEKRFRMIEDAGIPVVADYGEAWERVQALRDAGPSREGFRRLQRFTVSLQANEVSRLRSLGVLEPLLPWTEMDEAESWVLKEHVKPAAYDNRFGFTAQGGEGYAEDGLFG